MARECQNCPLDIPPSIQGRSAGRPWPAVAAADGDDDGDGAWRSLMSDSMKCSSLWRPG